MKTEIKFTVVCDCCGSSVSFEDKIPGKSGWAEFSLDRMVEQLGKMLDVVAPALKGIRLHVCPSCISAGVLKFPDAGKLLKAHTEGSDARLRAQMNGKKL